MIFGHQNGFFSGVVMIQNGGAQAFSKSSLFLNSIDDF
jgi:hypothetical protein